MLIININQHFKAKIVYFQKNIRREVVDSKGCSSIMDIERISIGAGRTQIQMTKIAPDHVV